MKQDSWPGENVEDSPQRSYTCHNELANLRTVELKETFHSESTFHPNEQGSKGWSLSV